MFSWLKPAHRTEIGYPPLPAGLAAYAIGDIHGRIDLLERLHEQIDADREASQDEAIEIYLGDYVDRGVQSAAVLDRLIERSGKLRTVFLAGNHEAVMRDVLEGTAGLDGWLRYGGVETLISYKVDVTDRHRKDRHDQIRRDFQRQVPGEHRAFLNTLKTEFELGDYLFVHAGVRPGVAIDRQSVDDLLWIRGGFLEHRGDFGRIVVHGHSPVDAPDFRPNRINIDTGAYATNRLTCLKIDGRGPHILGSAAQ
ncbi:MAG: metallophosphoesterase [Hyphomicrobiales bacterium]